MLFGYTAVLMSAGSLFGVIFFLGVDLVAICFEFVAFKFVAEDVVEIIIDLLMLTVILFHVRRLRGIVHRLVNVGHAGLGILFLL